MLAKIGIFGYGFVGQAQHSIITETHRVEIHDPAKGQEINEDDVCVLGYALICVPTPTNDFGEQDPSAFNECMKYLKDNDFNGTVIIKSTILYKHVEPYVNEFNVVHSPEFLRQNTYIDDARNQKTILIGGDYDAVEHTMEFYTSDTILKDLKFEICTLKEAIDFKYTRNIYGAYKVLFWEFIQETTGNSRKMAELYKKFPQSEMSQVGLDGHRGYGGACFPKDVQAWTQEHGHPLTLFMRDFNENL